MSLGRRLLTVLPSFLPLRASFSVLFFYISRSLFFLLPFLLQGALASCPHQRAGTSSFLCRAQPFPKGAACPCPQGTPSSLLGGIRRAKLLFFFPFPPCLMKCLFQPVGGQAVEHPLATPPLVFCFACPCGWLSGIFPICAFVPTGAPMPCPRIPGCSLGQAEQVEKKAESPKCAILQDQEAEGDSPSSLRCCAPTVKLRWEAIKM